MTIVSRVKIEVKNFLRRQATYKEDDQERPNQIDRTTQGLYATNGYDAIDGTLRYLTNQEPSTSSRALRRKVAVCLDTLDFSTPGKWRFRTALVLVRIRATFGWRDDLPKLHLSRELG